jgi:acetyltransferase-like isoleucine patch superfamily enzyme
VVGERVTFGRNVVFNCDKVRIGDGVVFMDNVQVNATEFEIGDYATIYDGCFFPGPGSIKIGHNFWLGRNALVDCKAGTTIGNNILVGAQSQCWTHMVWGDVMMGHRFHSHKPLVIDDDAWLVGHCLVSPVHIGAWSVAMLGSVVTRDMESNHVYAGVPAKDVTEKFGVAHEATSLDARVEYLEERLAEFATSHGISNAAGVARVTTSLDDARDVPENVTVFDVATRTYRKRSTPLEHELMRALVQVAKFTPAPDRD